MYLFFFTDFFVWKNKAHGLVSKFSQSHGKLENYNIGLKYKRKSKYKTHTYRKESKIKKVITDKCDCDMDAWMGYGSKLTLKSVESPLCILLSTKGFFYYIYYFY